MKQLFIVVLLLISPIIGYCKPFLFSDPQDGVTSHEITFPGQVPFDYPAQENGSLKFDLTDAAFGNNTLTIKSVVNSELWGRLESDPVQFTFERPGNPSEPTGLTVKSDGWEMIGNGLTMIWNGIKGLI